MSPFPKEHARPARTASQRGMTLVIVLVLLVLVTIFAVTAIRTSTVGLRVVGNQQTQRQMEAAAQNAIEQVLSLPASFGPTATARTIPVSGFSVSVSAPTCLLAMPAAGYSASLSSASVTPEDNIFEIVANVSDPVSGATATVHQAVRMRALAGACS